MIYILVVYDVATSTEGGQKRLRKVSKICEKYGQRVQNSTFEIWTDWGEYQRIQHDIASIIDKENDSVRFYQLNKNYAERIKHFGAKQTYDPQNDALII